MDEKKYGRSIGIFEARGSQFVYIDKKGLHVLLDLEDYFSNKGRIPFHSDVTNITIPNLIVDMLDKHDEFSEGTDQARLSVYYTMIDVLFIREHIKSSYPKRILELGAGNGVLTAHLTGIADVLHPESEYYQITIDNDVSELKACEDGMFDITLINGSDNISDHMDIVTEALRLTASGGYIICLAEGQPYLANSFRLFAPTAEEYTLDGMNYILAVTKL